VRDTTSTVFYETFLVVIELKYNERRAAQYCLEWRAAVYDLYALAEKLIIVLRHKK
jgi:hypothetical protein